MNPTTTPKDFFLHLGATAVLYTAVSALIRLAFSIIDYLRSDQLASYYSPGALAWPIAVLVVTVPVLALLEWLIIRDIRTMPEKKIIWVRRWRIFLTLFLAAALVVGDLIALLNTYFNGEITSRFAWKIAIILVVSAAVGIYYFYALYDGMRRAAAMRRISSWTGLALVLAAIVGGFLINGSPATQRAIRFDAERVSDMSGLQWQIVSYWQRTGKLPASLADLADPISGFAVPTDPRTGEQYGYSIATTSLQGFASFDLCATFDLATPDTKGRGAYGGPNGSLIVPQPIRPADMDSNWAHGPGRVCFARSIDPTKYPRTPKAPAANAIPVLE